MLRFENQNKTYYINLKFQHQKITTHILRFKCTNIFTVLSEDARTAQRLCRPGANSRTPVSIFTVHDVLAFDPPSRAVPEISHNIHMQSPRNTVFDISPAQRQTLQTQASQDFFSRHGFSGQYWPLCIQLHRDIAILIAHGSFSRIVVDIMRRWDRSLFHGVVPLSRHELTPTSEIVKDAMHVLDPLSVTVNAEDYSHCLDLMRLLLHGGNDDLIVAESKRVMHWLLDCTEMLSGVAFMGNHMTTAHGGKGGTRFTGVGLLLTVILASNLKDAGKITKTMDASIRCLLPPNAADALLTQLMDLPVPSKSTVSRARFWTDLSFVLFYRDEYSVLLEADGGIVLYAKADSSPQCGNDWMMCKVKYAKLPLVADFLQSFFEYILMLASADLEESLFHAWLDWTKAFKKLFTTHTQTPVALGQRRSSLAHKLSAIVWTWYLETPSIQMLRKFFACMVSICTDQGTESGIADVADIPLPLLLQQLPELEVEEDDGIHTYIYIYIYIYIYRRPWLRSFRRASGCSGT
jgi:hypothetical protein